MIHFSVDPGAVGPALQGLLQRFAPKDLSVTDPPIEDVIGKAITNAATASP